MILGYLDRREVGRVGIGPAVRLILRLIAEHREVVDLSVQEDEGWQAQADELQRVEAVGCQHYGIAFALKVTPEDVAGDFILMAATLSKVNV